MIKRRKKCWKILSMLYFTYFTRKFFKIKSKCSSSILDSLLIEIFAIEMIAIHRNYQWVRKFFIYFRSEIWFTWAWNTTDSN